MNASVDTFRETTDAVGFQQCEDRKERTVLDLWMWTDDAMFWNRMFRCLDGVENISNKTDSSLRLAIEERKRTSRDLNDAARHVSTSQSAALKLSMIAELKRSAESRQQLPSLLHAYRAL